MKNLDIVVYTMQGCPYCVQFKDMLKENSIEFHDRDIDEFEDEYNMFSEITRNDSVPALMIIEGDEDNYKSYLYAPDRDYNELVEALEIVKNHQQKIIKE